MDSDPALGSLSVLRVRRTEEQRLVSKAPPTNLILASSYDRLIENRSNSGTTGLKIPTLQQDQDFRRSATVGFTGVKTATVAVPQILAGMDVFRWAWDVIAEK